MIKQLHHTSLNQTEVKKESVVEIVENEMNKVVNSKNTKTSEKKNLIARSIPFSVERFFPSASVSMIERGALGPSKHNHTIFATTGIKQSIQHPLPLREQ